jgi:hypothetical protein
MILAESKVGFYRPKNGHKIPVIAGKPEISHELGWESDGTRGGLSVEKPAEHSLILP